MYPHGDEWKQDEKCEKKKKTVILKFPTLQ